MPPGKLVGAALRSCSRLIQWACRKLNTSPATLDDKDVLKKPLCMPLVRKVDLHFPLGLEVTARNLRGVTIKDALDAIYKQFKKKVRDVHPATVAGPPA
jgi:hypothetical protein